MRIALFLLLASLLAGCKTASIQPALTSTQSETPQAVASDPIDLLVAKLLASGGMWQNGLFPVLGLPATATPEQVVSRYFSMGLPSGQVPDYKILKIREVHIPITGMIAPDLYTAALLWTSTGEKILLFQYQGAAVGWWSRVYDAKTA